MSDAPRRQPALAEVVSPPDVRARTASARTCAPTSTKSRSRATKQMDYQEACGCYTSRHPRPHHLVVSLHRTAAALRVPTRATARTRSCSSPDGNDRLTTFPSDRRGRWNGKHARSAAEFHRARSSRSPSGETRNATPRSNGRPATAIAATAVTDDGAADPAESSAPTAERPRDSISPVAKGVVNGHTVARGARHARPSHSRTRPGSTPPSAAQCESLFEAYRSRGTGAQASWWPRSTHVGARRPPRVRTGVRYAVHDDRGLAARGQVDRSTEGTTASSSSTTRPPRPTIRPSIRTPAAGLSLQGASYALTVATRRRDASSGSGHLPHTGGSGRARPSRLTRRRRRARPRRRRPRDQHRRTRRRRLSGPIRKLARDYRSWSVSAAGTRRPESADGPDDTVGSGETIELLTGDGGLRIVPMLRRSGPRHPSVFPRWRRPATRGERPARVGRRAGAPIRRPRGHGDSAWAPTATLQPRSPSSATLPRSPVRSRNRRRWSARRSRHRVAEASASPG